MAFSLNPIDWVESGAKAVWDGTKWVVGKAVDVPGWVWDGAKWVYGKLTDPCTYIFGGLSFIPGASDFIKNHLFQPISAKLGPGNICSPTGQQLAVVGLAAFLTAHGSPAGISYLGASFGVGEIVSCLCAHGGPNVKITPPSGPPPSPTSSWVAPVLIGGGALLAFALVRRRFIR